MNIPNLFTTNNEAKRLYSLMLARLSMYDAFEELIDAANQIRQHAIETVGERASLFTMSQERDAYWYLGRHDENWERHKQCETLLFGGLLDITADESNERDLYFVTERRSPLHYACGRFPESVACKELQLSLAFDRVSSSEMFFSVTNDDKGEPTHPVRVTLRHVYEAFGKSLNQWEHWFTFVNGLPETLLKAANTTIEQLKTDSSQLEAVGTALVQQRMQTSSKRTSEFRSSPWEAELIEYFPFIESYPFPRRCSEHGTA